MVNTLLKRAAIPLYFFWAVFFYWAIQHSILLNQYLPNFHFQSHTVSPWTMLFNWIFGKGNPYKFIICSVVLITIIFRTQANTWHHQSSKWLLGSACKGIELLYLALFFCDLPLSRSDAFEFLSFWWICLVYRFLLLDVLYQKPNENPGQYHPFWN